MKLWFHNTLELWTIVAIVVSIFGIVKLALWIVGMI